MIKFNKVYDSLIKSTVINEAVDLAPEKQLEMFKMIDWNDYKARLNQLLGEDIKIEPSATMDKYWGGEYLNIDLNAGNLRDKCGIWKAAVTKITLTTESGIAKNEENPEEYFLSIKTAFSYSHPGGGSNGVTLMRSWYNFTSKTWDHRIEGENRG